MNSSVAVHKHGDAFAAAFSAILPAHLGTLLYRMECTLKVKQLHFLPERTHYEDTYSTTATTMTTATSHTRTSSSHCRGNARLSSCCCCNYYYCSDLLLTTATAAAATHIHLPMLSHSQQST
eukprot:18746-Heterococcus_DN1.PRE.1